MSGDDVPDELMDQALRKLIEQITRVTADLEDQLPSGTAMRTALLVSFLLGVGALPAQDREFGTAVKTTLTQVRQDAEAFKNVKVSFTVQFASLGKIANPFFTKFTPTDFANFYAWADEQPIWQEKAYNDVFGMLFLSKSHPSLEKLYELRVYQRLQVTGVVRNTFQDTPWIEVTDFTPLEEQLDTALLTHLYRGEKLMEQRLWQRAIAELSLAPGEGVPPHATRAAHRNLGICPAHGRSPGGDQLPRVGLADEQGPGPRGRAAAGHRPHRPSEAIDRTVDARTLKDSERPMWEAFDADEARRAVNMSR